MLSRLWRRFALAPLFAFLAVVAPACGPQAAEAQTVTFAGTQRALGSGLNAPQGVAVDGSGNVYVADTSNSVVKEILAVGGSIPVSNPTINTLGSGFTNPGGIAVDANGNVFVADSGNNAVKEILAAGGYTTVNTLGSGFFSPAGVAVDANGNVFVADFGNNAVKEILAAGGYTTVNTLGSGFSGPSGVAVDGNENVFVADRGNGAVKEMLAAGGYTTINNLSSGLISPTGVALDGSDNLFVTDNGTLAVYEMLASSGYWTANTVGGGFLGPNGIAVDGHENVFVAGAGNSEIEEVPSQNVNFGSVNVCPAGQTSPAPCSGTLTLTYNITSSGTLGTPQMLTVGTPSLDFTLAGGNTCTGAVTIGATCSVTVNFAPVAPGSRKGAVQIVDGSGNLLAATTISGTGTASAIAFSPSLQASVGSGFVGPAGMAVDGSGNVFIADFSNAQVKEVIAAGGYTTVKTLGGGFNFGGPEGVALDGNGNVFVADYANYAVYEILAAGGYTTVNTLASGFSFSGPSGVAVDGGGNVFVTDFSGAALYEILAAGGYSTVLRLAGNFNFGAPNGLAIDASGNLYVADSSNGAVYQILPGGNYYTVTPIGTGFTAPLGVGVDAAGNVFVTDVVFNTVKEILGAGNYATIVSLGSGFEAPSGVAVDASGNVFVSDADTAAVEVIERSQPPNFSFAATNAGGTSADSPQSAQVQNIGNQPLTGTGTLDDAIDFTVVAGSGTVPDCDGVLSLPSGAMCNVSVSFTPQAGGPIASTFALSSNALNGNPATQGVQLSGTGIGGALAISGISPNYGAPASIVILAGNNFGATQGSSSVTINGAICGVTAWSNTSIAIRVPSNASTGNVVVRVGGISSNGMHFTFYPYPAITALSPASGPVGTPVTITGTGLMDGGGNGVVTFNGTPAIILSQTATSIQVNVPAGATTGPVSVHANGNTVRGASFTIAQTLPQISALNPNYGSPASVITIAGTNFGATQGTVTINGAICGVNAWSNTSIAIRVPSNASTGNVVVTAGATASNGAAFAFYPYPAITALSPASGPVGSPVTITGTGLMDGGGNGVVTFNGTLATILSQTATSIQINVPAGATTGPVSVHANGNTVKSASFAVTEALTPQITGLSANYGAPASVVTVAGTNFGATQGTVTINGAICGVNAWSNTSIAIRVPSNASTGNVIVKANSQASNGVAFTFYPYPAITGITPTSAPVGTPVTIAGTSLLDGGNNPTVTFNDTPTAVLGQTSTGLQVNVPAGATTGQLRVRVNGVTLLGMASFPVTPTP